MQAIADFSGLGRTTVYRHFPGRESLFEALMVEVMNRSTAAMNEITEAGMTAEQTLRAVGAANVELGLRFRFLYSHQDVAKPALQSRTRANDGAVATFLTVAQARAEVAPI